MKPRHLTDNGPCYKSDELRNYLDSNGINHIDVFNGRSKEIENMRSRIKIETLGYRKLQN
jgi:hypothetical protein